MFHNFTCSQPLTKCLSSPVNPIIVSALYRRPLYIASSKEYLTETQNISRGLESAVHQLCCLKFSFKLIDFLRVIQEHKNLAIAN